MEIGRLLTELVRFPREVSAGRREKVAYLSLSRQGQGGEGGGGTKAGASIVRFNYIWITESDN